MKYSNYSVVIVGSGIAGLYASLKIEQQTNLPDGILLITKSKLGESNSRYAQGGMVAVMHDNKADSTESHISDTIKAGAGLSEFSTVKFISERSDSVVKDLLKFGVEFDRDENGHLCFTREAAHSVRRILHSGGDATGRMIEKALTKDVTENQNIDVYDHCEAIDTVLHKGKIGEVYNIGGHNEKTNMEITRLILDAMGKDESSIQYVEDRLGHDRRYAIANDKITSELGWEPSLTFEEGIKITIDWYLNNQDWMKKIEEKKASLV